MAAVTIELPRAIAASGTLAALDELEFGFQVPGRLERLMVDLGDLVDAGALLATLDRRDFELAVARAIAALDQARAQLGVEGGDPDIRSIDIDANAAVRGALAVLAEATLNRDRIAELVQQSLRPSSDLQVAEASFAVAQSRLQQARDQVRIWLAELRVREQDLAAAQQRLADTAIRAPWAGRVAGRLAAAGQYLGVGAAVLRLVRTDPLRLRLEVPERVAGQVRQGQRVAFTVDGFDGEFVADVTRLGAGIDRVNRTLVVEAAAANGDGRLLVGGFCRARIVVAVAEPAVGVPSSALVTFAGVDRVFEVQDGRAVERLVTPGRRVGELVEIVSGVAAGALVVRTPGDLVHGAPVTVVER